MTFLRFSKYFDKKNNTISDIDPSKKKKDAFLIEIDAPFLLFYY